MTFAGNSIQEDKGLEDDYPSAFGITFTPMVTGIALAIFGIAGAIYIYLNISSGAREEYRGIKTQLDEKQAQLDQMQQTDFPQQMASLQAEIAEQNALKTRVTAMFTNQEDLETLLLDLNSFITANGGELVRYNPDSQISVISDSSLGNEVNGKLKRKGFSLDIEGTFDETQAIIQDIERLQPLLLIQNYSSNVTEQPTVILTSNFNELVPQSPAILTTSLQIDAILPMSQQELEAAQQAAEAEAEDEAETEDGENQ